MLIPTENLSPQQVRVVRELSDGKYHETEELIQRLGDQMDKNLLAVTVFQAKTTLRRSGFTIVNEQYSGRPCYRLARFIDDDE